MSTAIQIGQSETWTCVYFSQPCPHCGGRVRANLKDGGIASCQKCRKAFDLQAELASDGKSINLTGDGDALTDEKAETEA